MFSPKFGLRHSMGESSILELSVGMNKTELLGKYNAEWEESYAEAKIVFGSVFEVKYTYIFNQTVKNPENISFLPGLIHNAEGAVLTFGFNIGSLN